MANNYKNMKKAFHYQISIWQVLLTGIIVCWLCIRFSGIGWAETPEQTQETTFPLKDGTVIELTTASLVRKQLDEEPKKETILWSIQAKEPQLPLVFENRDGLQLVLFFTKISGNYGEFRAVRIENGQSQWVHPMWIKMMPVSPLFVKPWIYVGRGIWLEQIDPDNGTVVARYHARVNIQSLQALPDGAIEVQAETVIAGKITLSFQDGHFSPHIAAPGDLLASQDLFYQAEYVMQDFYDEYLKLHRIEKDLPPPEFVAKWRIFDLQEAEKAYRRAYQTDPTNPYMALFLGLALHYQNQKQDAEFYFQDALLKSQNIWEDSLRLGSIFEELRLTRWADRFYEQGTRRYFQEVPAPPHDVLLLEVKIHFQGHRASSALFYHGHVDRALHVLEVRRQIFPYVEGDFWFFRKYARWLRRMGQEEKAVLEEQQINRTLAWWNEFKTLTPFGFRFFMIPTGLLLGIIILKNEVRHAKSLIPIFVYLRRMILSRRARNSRENHTVEGEQLSAASLRSMLLKVLVSSYLVFLAGLRIAYMIGDKIGRSFMGGKIAECLFIVAFIGAYCWVRRVSGELPSFRNLKLFILMWIVMWFHIGWFNYYLSIVGAEAATPLPTIDRGHPTWIAYIDKKVSWALSRAPFRNPNLIFAQALVHHLGGDNKFARQVYTELASDVRALNNLGVMLWKENPAGARDYFKQALQIEADFAPALYNLGVLAGDLSKIEQAKTGDPWRVNVYQKYAPDKPWIVIPAVSEWSRAEYWTYGGFWSLSFTETPLYVVRVFNALR